MDKYIAVYLPDGEYDPTKRGFNSEEDAWNYIKECICSDCKQILVRGYELYKHKEEVDKIDCTHPCETACGCEWLVMKESDYDKAETIHDLFEAGGWREYKASNNES